MPESSAVHDPLLLPDPEPEPLPDPPEPLPLPEPELDPLPPELPLLPPELLEPPPLPEPELLPECWSGLPPSALRSGKPHTLAHATEAAHSMTEAHRAKRITTTPRRRSALRRSSRPLARGRRCRLSAP